MALRRTRRGSPPALAAVVALALLWAPFLIGVDPAREQFMLDWRLPVIVPAALALMAALVLLGRRLGRVSRAILATLLLLAAVLQLAGTLVRHFLARGLDLYFDLGNLPSVVGLVTTAAGPVRAGLAAVLALAALVAIVLAMTWALGAWARLMTTERRAAIVLVLSLALVGGVAVAPGRFSAAAPDVVARQAARLYRAMAVTTGLDQHDEAALATPPPPVTNLAALKDRDVFLVYIESYGTAVLDVPSFRAVVAPALQDFARTVTAAGYHLVSSRLVSPVFGGGSWLAHATLDSGLKLDPFLYRFLTESRRETLPAYFRADGHRTVAVMPGITKPWPEARFFGFEHDYFAANLGYSGPPFGWFRIPDQYTLARFDADELAPGHKPLFAEIVLVSSHTPFAPVPPYVAHWHQAGPYKDIPQAEWHRIYREPDWAHLDRPYLQSVVYDLRTLGQWLAELQDNGLVIILGDHQPPGVIPRASPPWTVPIHILSRDPALVAPFVKAGYVAGAIPPEAAKVKGMERFLGDFLADFSRRGAAGTRS